MSEVLYKFIRPHFKQIIPNDKEFDAIFDYYEFICAIVFVKIDQENNIGWGPIGRFGDRDRKILQRKLDQAKNEQNDFELIAWGIVDSYKQFEEAVEHIEDFLKYLNYR